MKKVAKINYIKVLILAIITVLLVLILTNIYNNKKQYDRANDGVMSFLSTIKYDELKEFLVENTDGFIYISSSSDATLDSFEVNFKEYILNENLDKELVYMDSSEFSNDLYTDLKKSYFADGLSKQIEIGKSTLLAVKDGKFIAVLNINYDDDNLSQVKQFISNYGVNE